MSDGDDSFDFPDYSQDDQHFDQDHYDHDHYEDHHSDHDHYDHDHSEDHHSDHDHSDGPDHAADDIHAEAHGHDYAVETTLSELGPLLDQEAAIYDPDEAAGIEPIPEGVVMGLLWPAEDVDADQLIASVLERLGIPNQ